MTVQEVIHNGIKILEENSVIYPDYPKNERDLKTWVIPFEENFIRIDVSLDYQKLFFNDVLIDEEYSYAPRSKLTGYLPDKRKIEVSVNGWFYIYCVVNIDNKEIFKS